MLIDSRPAPRYNEGHIPGAVSIPLAELERADRAGKVHPRLPAEKDTRLIFYCGGITCPLSPRSAAIVIKQGFTSVRVFHDGEPAWTKAELPLQASARFIKDGNAVLLDIRPPDRFAAGHLERALNIPFRHIGSRFGKEFFPGYKPAPIVIIGDSQEELLTTFERLRDWGYSRVVTFPADPGRWQREGLALVTGFQPPPPKLDYVRILGPFEVSIPDFHQALANSNSLIIDTRSSTEYYVGHLPGALNIPSGEGEDSYGDIPREPPVYLYCATGARAEMLFAILRAQGYLNVRVLKATVEFEGDGYRIRE
jgi:rhodanese-related sulfurtransferase